MSLYTNLIENVPECNMLKESQMAFLLNNDSIKATQARQKILLFTLSRLDHFKITTIVQARTSLDKHKLGLGDLKFEQIIGSKSVFVLVMEALLTVLQASKEPRDASKVQLVKAQSRQETKQVRKVEPLEDRYTALLERVKTLESKNLLLEQDKSNLATKLASVQELYDTLVGQERVSKQPTIPKKALELNERRNMLLQSQIIQLKRQMGTYKEIALKKELFVYSAQEQVYLLLERMKKYISTLDKEKKLELDQIVKRLEALGKHIVRQEQNHIDDDLDPQFQFMSEFIAHGSLVTLDTVSNGTIDHVNLKQISRLEIQLQKLYSSLSELKGCISTCLEPNIGPQFQDRIQSVFENSMDHLINSMNSLLSLSSLIPVAPLPDLKQKQRPALVFQDIMNRCNPPLSDATIARLRPVLEPLFIEIQKQNEYTQNDIKALNKELEFHRNLYTKYTTSIAALVGQVKEERGLIKKQMQVVLVELKKRLIELTSLEWNEDKVASYLESLEKQLKDQCVVVSSLVSSIDLS